MLENDSAKTNLRYLVPVPVEDDPVSGLLIAHAGIGLKMSKLLAQFENAKLYLLSICVNLPAHDSVGPDVSLRAVDT